MTPADRLTGIFFGLLAIGASVGIVVLLWRACEACRTWWGS